MNMTLEEIARALQGRDVVDVAYHTGLHPNTIRKYRDGDAKQPAHETVTKLTDYLTERALR